MAVAQGGRGSKGAGTAPSPQFAAVVEQITAALPELGCAQAEDIVSAMSGRTCRGIHDHLGEHRDALVSGSSLAPPPVQRLIHTLAAAGFDRVRVPACHRCGRIRALVKVVEGGRVCGGCAGALAYAAAVGVCRECSRTKPLPAQGLCSACYARGRNQTKTKTACASCGQLRLCKQSRADGRSLCDTCRPRPTATCSLCGTSSKIQARWPVGPVCANCYMQVRINPAPCSVCERPRALIGRVDGEPACGPCCGVETDYACSRCANPADSVVGGLCEQCAFDDQATDYFHALPATPQAQLSLLRDRLQSGEQPRAARSWLKHSASARLLSELVAGGQRITHEALDVVCQEPDRGYAAGYLRDVLVDAGVLPPRDEHTASVERRFAQIIGAHPRLAAVLHAYGYGSVLPRLRSRERPGTEYVADWATARMISAVDLLTWAGGRSLTLTRLAQDDVDQWLAEGASTRHNVRDFLVWAAEDGRAQPLLVPHRDKPDPVGMAARSHWELLQQCLRDEALALETRVAGALVLLYGQQATRIVALHRDCLRHREGGSYLILGETPVMLPPALARLIAELAAAENPVTGERVTSRWLFPNARNRMRHQSAASVTALLNAYGITIKPARASALMNAAMDLPPAELSAKLGMHLITAEQWRRLAARTWTAYLRTPATERE